MKIMQICFTPVIGSAGGIEKVFCNMANHFSLKHQVVNVCCDGKKGSTYYPLDDRVQFYDLLDHEIRTPCIIKIKSELIRILKKAKLINCELPKNLYRVDKVKDRFSKIYDATKPDVIICYSYEVLPLLIRLEINLEKVIVMFHSKFTIEEIADEDREALKKVSAIQVLFDKLRDYMEAEGYRQTICIGNAIGLDVPINLDIRNREKTIVCVARLDRKVKRQHHIIEAFSKLKDKYPDWRVKFYGGNPYPYNYIQELERLIQSNNLENKVEFMGIRNNILEQIKHDAIFVLPSIGEGFPVALGEAMSAGLPVIGYEDCSGVNDLIENGINGLLCKNSIDGLAMAMDTLMGSEELRLRLGLHGREDMLNYKPCTIMKKWDDVVDKVYNRQL